VVAYALLRGGAGAGGFGRDVASKGKGKTPSEGYVRVDHAFAKKIAARTPELPEFSRLMPRGVSSVLRSEMVLVGGQD